MARKTISLENSAYERLEAAKLPGESFSEVINRLVEGKRPSFSLFDALLDQEEGAELAKTFNQMRTEERESERNRVRG